jgi:hypothetical protein
MALDLAHAGLNLLVAACLDAAIGLERGSWRSIRASWRLNPQAP